MPLNDDPFQPWNSPMYKDNPLAPHNGIDRDNPLKPWNSPCGNQSGLTGEEAQAYNISRRRGYEREQDNY